MEFGEVLDALFRSSSTLTGYDENIILLKEIEKAVSGGCKTDLILDVVDVDEQWILDSDDEVNILICVLNNTIDALLDDGLVDLCKLFNDPEITIGIMAAPRHSDIFFNHFSETYSRAEWVRYSPKQLNDFTQKYFMYVVLGIKVGFFCLNWTHNQLQQLMDVI